MWNGDGGGETGDGNSEVLRRWRWSHGTMPTCLYCLPPVGGDSTIWLAGSCRGRHMCHLCCVLRVISQGRQCSSYLGSIGWYGYTELRAPFEEAMKFAAPDEAFVRVKPSKSLPVIGGYEGWGVVLGCLEDGADPAAWGPQVDPPGSVPYWSGMGSGCWTRAAVEVEGGSFASPWMGEIRE